MHVSNSGLVAAFVQKINWHITQRTCTRTHVRHFRTVRKLTGITDDHVADAPTPGVVLRELVEYVISDTKAASERDGQQYRPVLLAHNGNTFDFKVLLRIMLWTRVPLDLKQQLWFADTMGLLRKVLSFLS